MFKKVVKILLGVFGLFALIIGLTTKKSSKRVREIKKDLKENEDNLSNVREKKNGVKEEKDNIATEIKKGIENIEESKKSKPIVKKKSIKDANKSLKNRING